MLLKPFTALLQDFIKFFTVRQNNVIHTIVCWTVVSWLDWSHRSYCTPITDNHGLFFSPTVQIHNWV